MNSPFEAENKEENYSECFYKWQKNIVQNFHKSSPFPFPFVEWNYWENDAILQMCQWQGKWIPCSDIVFPTSSINQFTCLSKVNFVPFLENFVLLVLGPTVTALHTLPQNRAALLQANANYKCGGQCISGNMSSWSRTREMAQIQSGPSDLLGTCSGPLCSVQLP